MNRNIHEALGRYLAIRSRSEHEIRVYLERKKLQYQLDDEKIESLIAKYRSIGLVDDVLFTEATIHSAVSKGKGRNFMRMKLKAAGVDAVSIQTELEKLAPEDSQMAMEKRLHKYARKWEGLDPKMKKQKAFGALYASGFSSGEIARFIDVWIKKE